MQVVTEVLVVTVHPAEAAFHDPVTRQEDKAKLAFKFCNYLQVNVMHSRCVLSLFARVALVDEAHLHGLARQLWHNLPFRAPLLSSFGGTSTPLRLMGDGRAKLLPT